MGDKAIKIEQGDDDAGKQQQKQPPKIVTKIRGGKKRDYNFLKTVNSVDELDNFRFKNYCVIQNRKLLPTFTSLIIPCTRKRSRYQPEKQCDFQLMAVHQDPENGIIHVYAHGEHNHPLMPEEQRKIKKKAKELMPAANPPRILRTPDNTEWTFLLTFADYNQLQKFRQKSQCKLLSAERKNHWRFRLFCNRRWSHNCEFKLLALKTTKQGYHVYTFGEHQHNHHVIKPKKKQKPAARGHQQKQKEMEVDEEEGEEDDDDEQEEDETEEEGESEEDEAEEDNEEGGEEDDDIIVIDGEDDGIKIEQQQQEDKPKGPKEKTAETPQGNEANPRVETLEEKLANAYYEWMAGIGPNQIGTTVVGMNIAAVLKMVQMADQEVRKHPEKFAVWRPWLKFAIKKYMSEVEDVNFGTKYKGLIILMMDHVQD